MNPQDMGTTGLIDWVNASVDPTEFGERRRQAEDIIAERYGPQGADRFLRQCDDRPMVARFTRKIAGRVDRVRELGNAWRKDLKSAWLAGKPVPIVATSQAGRDALEEAMQ